MFANCLYSFFIKARQSLNLGDGGDLSPDKDLGVVGDLSPDGLLTADLLYFSKYVFRIFALGVVCFSIRSAND